MGVVVSFVGKVTLFNTSDTVNLSGVIQDPVIVFGLAVTRLQGVCTCMCKCA